MFRIMWPTWKKTTKTGSKTRSDAKSQDERYQTQETSSFLLITNSYAEGNNKHNDWISITHITLSAKFVDTMNESPTLLKGNQMGYSWNRKTFPL